MSADEYEEVKSWDEFKIHWSGTPSEENVWRDYSIDMVRLDGKLAVDFTGAYSGGILIDSEEDANRVIGIMQEYIEELRK